MAAVVGPGIITANVDNDAGGIATYSIAGAHFGYTLIWSLIPIAISLVVIQEMCNRMGVITGKGLSALIRERFGVKPIFYILLALLFTNLGNILAEFAGIAASVDILMLGGSGAEHTSLQYALRQFAVIAAAVFVWLLLLKGTYKSVERIFLGACVFYVSYIIAGVLAKPDWNQVAAETIYPLRGLKPGIVPSAYLIMLVGLIGTTIAPWMQFYQQASVAEKGIHMEDYAYSKLDTYLGGILVNVVAFFIIVLCGATLYQNHVRVETADQAANALAPLAGKYCSYLFAFGLLNASLFAASILPLSTSYSVCEGLGWESGVDRSFADAPHFYTIYTVLILCGAGTIFIPPDKLVGVMLVSQVINGLMLPLVLIFMLRLANDPEIMGKFVNNRFQNGICVLTITLVVVSSVAAIVQLF